MNLQSHLRLLKLHVRLAKWLQPSELQGTLLWAPDTDLREALAAFSRYPGERLPVVNNAKERVLAGSISKTDLLLTLAHGLRGPPHEKGSG